VREFTHSLTIQAPPAAVLDAFFDPEALASWWHVTRSLCVPRPLGVYAVEWVPTEWKDDVLGRLGGAFRGTVIEFKAGREFFIADAYWLPPDGEPIGPMALEATCTLLGERWSRYYDLIATGFTLALDELKRYVESHWND
jgi:uncharacterized protein YndB with AHSA1/START domain